MDTPRSQFALVMRRLQGPHQDDDSIPFYVFLGRAIVAIVGLVGMSMIGSKWSTHTSNLDFQKRRAIQLVAPYQQLYDAALHSGDPEVIRAGLQRIHDGMLAEGFTPPNKNGDAYDVLPPRFSRLPALRQISEAAYQEEFLILFKSLSTVPEPRSFSYRPQYSAGLPFYNFWLAFAATFLCGLVAAAIYLEALFAIRREQQVRNT